MKDQHSHTHVDEQGRLVRCYHECTSQLKRLSFWVMAAVGYTVGFPIEHYIWEKLPVFRDISAWLGL